MLNKVIFYKKVLLFISYFILFIFFFLKKKQKQKQKQSVIL